MLGLEGATVLKIIFLIRNGLDLLVQVRCGIRNQFVGRFLVHFLQSAF
jgi:hypothetical protein